MGQLSPSLRTTSTQPRNTLTSTTVPLHDEVIAATVTAKMMGIDGDDVDRDATTGDKWRRNEATKLGAANAMTITIVTKN